MVDILKYVEDFAGERVVDKQNSYGGDIARSQVLTFESGKRLFLKSGSHNDKMFPAEANSLTELAKANAIRIPEVYLSDSKFLLMENIKQARKSSSFFDDFGRRFAQMHKYTSGQYGLFEDNFIGHTPQQNIPNEKQAADWKSFYFEKRLLYQFRLAEKQGLTSAALSNGFRRLESKIDAILDSDDAQPSLLHGDLWSGNFISDERGNPVLIDPAVYYGHREADLAMTKVFGGFPSSFYKSYNEVYPFAAGYEYRENVYKLYHILNHLNLFGMGYHGQAVALIESYL